jgi:hypothetical protein
MITSVYCLQVHLPSPSVLTGPTYSHAASYTMEHNSRIRCYGDISSTHYMIVQLSPTSSPSPSPCRSRFLLIFIFAPIPAFRRTPVFSATASCPQFFSRSPTWTSSQQTCRVRTAGPVPQPSTAHQQAGSARPKVSSCCSGSRTTSAAGHPCWIANVETSTSTCLIKRSRAVVASCLFFFAAVTRVCRSTALRMVTGRF